MPSFQEMADQMPKQPMKDMMPGEGPDTMPMDEDSTNAIANAESMIAQMAKAGDLATAAQPLPQPVTVTLNAPELSGDQPGNAVVLVVSGPVTAAENGNVTVSLDQVAVVHGKMPPLGSGERFRNLSSKLGQQKGVKDPDALAAFIGREKMGKSRFQELAAAGRRNS
jgi:hypothetical protein